MENYLPFFFLLLQYLYSQNFFLKREHFSKNLTFAIPDSQHLFIGYADYIKFIIS